jgi:hypothetical protein
MDVYNVCILCGKNRITISEWFEDSPSGPIKRSKTACPDDNCQAKVEGLIEEKSKERARKEAARQARLAKIHQKQLEIVTSI